MQHLASWPLACGPLAGWPPNFLNFQKFSNFEKRNQFMQYLASWPLACGPLAGWPPNFQVFQKNSNFSK